MRLYTRISFMVIFAHHLSSVASNDIYSSRILDEVHEDEVIRRSLTTSNYSNPYDSFVPSQYMVMALSISGQKFPTSMAAASNTSYLFSIFMVPAILFVLGVLSLLSLNCGLLFRCCCFCCKCLPNFKPEVDNEERMRKLKYHRTTTLVFFYFFCFVAFVADQLSFIGNTSISAGKEVPYLLVSSIAIALSYRKIWHIIYLWISGVTDINLALGSIKKLMTSLIADSSNLVTLGNYIIKWRLNKSQTLLILLCFLSLFIGYFIYSFYFVVFHLLDEKLLLPCIFTFSTSIFFFFQFYNIIF